MSATALDIVIEQGATYTLTHTAQKALSGATATMKLRGNHGSAVVLTLATGSGISATVQGNTTTFTITITATQTAALSAPFAGVYDMETSLSGTVDRHIEGSFYVTPEATK